MRDKFFSQPIDFMNMEINRQFEVKHVARIVENKETEALSECIKTLEIRAKTISEGGNAVVYAAEGTPFEKVCLKKLRERPLLLGNSIDAEHQYQELVREAGVSTPLSLISIETNEGSFLIMERVNGCTVEEAIQKPALLPKDFDYKKFCNSLDEQIEKMHAKGIYHRDLHIRNVMIDRDGMPVIIDFGTATRGSGSDLTYEETVMMLNSEKGTYEPKSGYFTDDLIMVRNLKTALRSVVLTKSKVSI